MRSQLGGFPRFEHAMKKSAFVWVILTLLFISVFTELLAVSNLIVTQNLSSYYGDNVLLNTLAAIFLATDICVTAL